jgi:hypothetical protein
MIDLPTGIGGHANSATAGLSSTTLTHEVTNMWNESLPLGIHSRFSRRQLLGAGLTGAFGVALGKASSSEVLGVPDHYVIQVGSSSTQLVAANRKSTEVELRNASTSRIVFVTEGVTAWLRAGQCLLPGESLRTEFSGRINAVVDAYGDPQATAPLVVVLR